MLQFILKAHGRLVVALGVEQMFQLASWFSDLSIPLKHFALIFNKSTAGHHPGRENHPVEKYRVQTEFGTPDHCFLASDTNPHRHCEESQNMIQYLVVIIIKIEVLHLTSVRFEVS